MISWTGLIDGWPAWIGAVVLVLDVAIRVLMLGIVPGNRRPTTAMAWLMTIFFIPYVGLFIFLAFGSNKLNSRRRKRQLAINEQILVATRTERPRNALPDGHPDWVHSAVHLNHELGAFPPTSGNSLTYFTDYKASLRAVAEEIDRAKDYAHVQFYIVGDDPEYVDPVLSAMERAVARGVKVRFLYDQLGSWRVKGYKALKRRLTDGGIEWYRMLPLAPLQWRWRRPDLRNHRKIVVVDGQVAFTGSMNLIEPGYKRKKSHELGREWVEILARVEGPLVDHFDVVFATDWNLESNEQIFDQLEGAELDRPGTITGQVVPSGPGFPEENNLRLFNTLLYSAQHVVRMTSPYFVPDDSLLYAITTAAQRGVRVDLYVCEAGDHALTNHAQQSYYQGLLEAGVRIFRYRAPMVLHTKCVTIDDQVAVFGSSNFDMRSFSLNAEITTMLLGEESVDELDKVMDLYEGESTLLTLESWNERSAGQRWLDNVGRLTAVLQ
ncbi:MAG: cardiolipin synthase [Arthrobacter sp.]|nr:cardiolipin synthase [Arthrobacter sp.]